MTDTPRSWPEATVSHPGDRAVAEVQLRSDDPSWTITLPRSLVTMWRLNDDKALGAAAIEVARAHEGSGRPATIVDLDTQSFPAGTSLADALVIMRESPGPSPT